MDWDKLRNSKVSVERSHEGTLTELVMFRVQKVFRRFIGLGRTLKD